MLLFPMSHTFPIIHLILVVLELLHKNIDKVLKDTIIIKQRCNIEIRKNEIYAIPPILKVV